MEAQIVNDVAVGFMWAVAVGGIIFGTILIGRMDDPRIKASTGEVIAAWVCWIAFFFGMGAILFTAGAPENNQETIEQAYNLSIVDGGIPTKIGDTTRVVALLNDTDTHEVCTLSINNARTFDVACAGEVREVRKSLQE